MSDYQIDLSLWVLWISGTVVVLCTLALLIMRCARSELPPNPTSLQRLRHALWNSL